MISRVVYEEHYGPIPKGLVIDHKCGNGACVEPTHLRAITQRQNLLASSTTLASINASKTHCPAGHEYNEVNTYISKTGKRYCRACDRERHRKG